jgi:hypothetical protein
MAKPKWLEPLEQTGHFWMGFGARLLYLDLLYWRREAVKQWPPATDRLPILDIRPTARSDSFVGYTRKWSVPNAATDRAPTLYCSLERAEDTLRDLHWMIVGATCAELVRWPVVGLLIWKLA